MFFRPEKNGYWFTEGMPVGDNRVPPGKSHAELWKPYQVWQGDLWKCGGCEATIIVGTGLVPFRVHHEPDFDLVRGSLGADKFQVNDC